MKIFFMQFIIKSKHFDLQLGVLLKNQSRKLWIFNLLCYCMSYIEPISKRNHLPFLRAPIVTLAREFCAKLDSNDTIKMRPMAKITWRFIFSINILRNIPHTDYCNCTLCTCSLGDRYQLFVWIDGCIQIIYMSLDELVFRHKFHDIISPLVYIICNVYFSGNSIESSQY